MSSLYRVSLSERTSTCWRGVASLSLLTLGLISGIACTRVGPNTVATFDGGVVTIGDVEEEIRSLPENQRLRADLDLVATYRQLARGIALERILLGSERSDREPSTLEGHRERLAELRRTEPMRSVRALADLYAAQVVLADEMPRIDDERARAFYEEQRQRFRQDERVHLSTLLVRDVTAGGREAARSQVNDLRTAIQAGEPFADAARAYSDSETAPLGGEVGWVGRGVLPTGWEEIAFSLGGGEVSEPIETSDGVLLLYVRERQEEAVFPYEQVQTQIRSLLRARAIEQTLAEWVAGREVPSGATVLTRDELFSLLDAAPEDDDASPVVIESEAASDGDGADGVAQGPTGEVALRLGDVVLEARDLRAWRASSTPRENLDVTADASESSESSGPTPNEQRDDALWRQYQEALRVAQLAAAARREGFDESPEVVAQLVRRLDAGRRRSELGRALQEEVRATVDGYAEEAEEAQGPLWEHYERHRDRYRTELELELRTVRIDRADRVAAAEAERARQRLLAGEIGMESLEEALGAQVGEPQAVAFSKLASVLDSKLARHVVQLAGVGVTPPVRIDDDLWMVEVLERSEPQIQEYDDVAERVRRDFLAERRGDLLRQITARSLEEADYEFHEDEVRATLGLAAEADDRGEPATS